jgi:hypothetical protein
MSVIRIIVNGLLNLQRLPNRIVDLAGLPEFAAEKIAPEPGLTFNFANQWAGG